MTMSTMEKNRVQIMPKTFRADIARHILHLTKQIQKIARLLDELIETEDHWRQKRAVMLSMAGRRVDDRQHAAWRSTGTGNARSQTDSRPHRRRAVQSR